MNRGDHVTGYPLRHIFSMCLLAGLAIVAQTCTPQVVRSTPPGGPTSAVEMAEDVERLDKLIEHGRIPRRELVAARDRYRTLTEQLRERPARDPALQQLAMARAEATLALYDDLLELSERPSETRAERASVAEASYARVRAYLEQLLQIQQGVDMTPTLFDAGEASAEPGTELREKALPPPASRRLFQAYQAGAYDRVIKEVEGHSTNGLETLDSGVLVAYALSLGAVGRTRDALDVMAALEDRASIEPLMLEVRYRYALWLLEEGRRHEASKVVEELVQALEQTGNQLRGLVAPTRAIQDDIAHASPAYLASSVDVRLAVAGGRFSEARTICHDMLAREVSRDTIDRVERLLAFVDAAETQAFEQALAEVEEVRLDRGSAAALEKLASVADRFEESKYHRRLESVALQLGTTLAELAGGDGGQPREQQEIAGGSTAPGGSPAGTEPEVARAPEQGEVEVSPGETGHTGVAQASAPVPGGPPAEVGPGKQQPGADLVGEASGAAGPDHAEESEAAGVPPMTPEPTGTAAPTIAPADMEAGRQALERATALSMAGRYREAIDLFDALAGTPLEDEARPLRQKAVDRHVQQVRERVAREYVRSSQIRDEEQRLELLCGIYEDLKAAIEAYPETTLKAKAEHNLKVIEGEIARLDPDYFDRREASP